MVQGDMFPEAVGKNPPLTLYAGEKHFHYMRHRNGQAQKCTLRSSVRGGKIVATIYTGEDDARYIIDAVNYYTSHKLGGTKDEQAHQEGRDQDGRSEEDHDEEGRLRQEGQVSQ